MGSKILYAYVAVDALFVIMGAIMLGFCVIVSNRKNDIPTDGREAAINLLYGRFPLTAGIVNAVFYFVTFLVTIPAIITPTRGLLKASGYLVFATALFSLIIGLDLWILTLNTKAEFAPLFASQSDDVKKLMQQAFKCCGYTDSLTPAFITDSVCTSPAAAALVRPCSAPISSFANVFVDDIFTGVFGMCGVGGLLILATSCLLKDRRERERFRYIDEKNGANRTF